MSDKDHWCNSGYEAIDDVENEYAERGGEDGLQRVYLKAGEDIVVVFETDEPFGIWEHQVPISIPGQKTNWRNWFTCRKKLGDCDLCGSNNSYYVGFYIVRDMTGWTDRKGNQRGVGERRLFPAKLKTLKQLKTISERKGGLKGWKVMITRTSNDAPNVGDLFDFDSKVDLSTLPDCGELPDLKEIFRPKSNEEIKVVLAGEIMGNSGTTEEDPVNY